MRMFVGPNFSQSSFKIIPRYFQVTVILSNYLFFPRKLVKEDEEIQEILQHLSDQCHLFPRYANFHDDRRFLTAKKAWLWGVPLDHSIGCVIQMIVYDTSHEA